MAHMQISENGVISFGQQFPDPFPSDLPLTSDSNTSSSPALIAGFWGDVDVQKNGGAIFYAEIDADNRRFGCSNARVLNLLREGYGGSLEDFEPTHIFQSTWESVHEYGQEVQKRVCLPVDIAYMESLKCSQHTTICLISILPNLGGT